MGEHPLWVCPPAALPFFGTQPAEAAILANGELRFAHCLSEFVRGVPFPHLLAFDQHSGYASLYPSAAMYLIRALASLRDQDMNIGIQGFYDDVVAPTEADRSRPSRKGQILKIN